MRRVALLLCVLALVGCGGAGGSLKAPTEAPDDGGELMQDFFTICSKAINSNPAAALAISRTLDWEQLHDDESYMPADIGTQYQLMHTETGSTINIFHYENPSEKATGCSIFVTDGAELINPQSMKQLKGFKGRWVERNGTGAGRWIKRSGQSILSVFGNQTDETFSLVNMNIYTLK